MYIDPSSSRNSSPAPHGGVASPVPTAAYDRPQQLPEKQQQYSAPQQQFTAPQQQYSAPQQQQYSAPQQQQQYSVPQQANNNIMNNSNSLNNSHFTQQQQIQTYQQTISSSSSNSIQQMTSQQPEMNKNHLPRPAADLSLIKPGGASHLFAAAPAAAGGPGHAAAPVVVPGHVAAPAAGGPSQNVSAPTRGRGVLTQQKPGMRVPMCGACDGQIRWLFGPCCLRELM